MWHPRAPGDAPSWGGSARMVPRSYEPPPAVGAPATGQSLEFPPGSVVHVHVNASNNQIGAPGPSFYGGGWCGGGVAGALVPTLPGLWPLPPLSLGGIPLASPYAAAGCCGPFVGPFVDARAGLQQNLEIRTLLQP